MRSKWLALAGALCFLVASAASGQGGSARRGAPAFAGLRLEQALQKLQAEGLPVIFSSQLVRRSMRVESEPRGTTPRAILDELLRPHGLRVVEAAGGRLVVVAGAPPRTPPPAAEPFPMPSVKEEILVKGSAAGGGVRGGAPATTTRRPPAASTTRRP